MKRPSKERLLLYTRLLPDVVRACKETTTAETVNPFLIEHLSLLSDERLTVFDCRPLPLGFVLDTGGAAYHEMEQTRAAVRLPSPNCYFEFAANDAIIAVSGEEIVIYEGSTHRAGMAPSSAFITFSDNAATLHRSGGRISPDQPPLGTIVRLRFYINPQLGSRMSEQMPATHPKVVEEMKAQGFDIGLLDDPEVIRASTFSPIVADFPNGVKSADYPDGAFFIPAVRFQKDEVQHEVEDVERNMCWVAAHMLLGVSGLLEEKLAIDEFISDPAPWWTRERRKKHKPPTAGDTHVLTVNVPAVRYAVSRSVAARDNTHESPMLHWRRGHWRVLHRYSEFEKQTWVRRCLVGDPSKGFINTQYRLTHEPPLLHIIDDGREDCINAQVSENPV